MDEASQKSAELLEEQRQIEYIESGAHKEWMKNIREENLEQAKKNDLLEEQIQIQTYQQAVEQKEWMRQRDRNNANIRRQMDTEETLEAIRGGWFKNTP